MGQGPFDMNQPRTPEAPQSSQAVTAQGFLLSSLRKELRFPTSYTSYRELFVLNRFPR